MTPQWQRMIATGRRDAISLLFAQRKKEQYETKGFIAFISHGIFPTDDLYEVYILGRKKKRHGDFVT